MKENLRSVPMTLKGHDTYSEKATEYELRLV